LNRREFTKRALKSYRVFGIIALAACFVSTIVILAASSLNGLRLHDFVVPVYTNSYGENWAEVVVIAVSAPSVALWFKHFLEDL
jgi:uncharacterized membrane protein